MSHSPIMPLGPEVLAEVKRVLVNEAKALAALTEIVDDSYLRAIEIILKSSGKLVTTGIGKSGIVARKAAATFSSTGTLAVFLHPSEALHGDLGMVSSSDVVMVFGKSGESSEISMILPSLKKLGTKIIAVTTRQDSTLARAADVTLWAKTEQEACPYDLAPTTSAVVAMAVADALALAIMKLKQFKPHDYAQLHPGGALGFRLNNQVRDLMIPVAKHPVIDPGKTSIEEIISRMGMVGLVLFSSDGKSLEGIMTDGDVRRALETYKAKIFDQEISKFINAKPLWIEASLNAAEALAFMEGRERPLNAVPVMDAGRVAGVLRLHDLLRS